MLKKLISCLILACCLFAFTACNANVTIKSPESQVKSSQTILTSSLEKSTTKSVSTEKSTTKSVSTEKSTAKSVSTEKSATKSSQTKSSSKPSTSTSLTTAQKNIITKATNVIDWQLENGGWGKNYDTTTTFTSYPSDYCWKVNNKFVGTIDNEATYTEMRLLAEAYTINGDSKFKASFDKGMAFLKNLQYSTGGFAQIYPHNGKYNDYVTFNDDAMVSVLEMLSDIAQNKEPFKTIVSDSERNSCKQMLDKAVEYILKAQITIGGKKTAWCAQHDPENYKPMKARSYELASVSGSESVGIIKFLKTQTDNEEALQAAETARLWLKERRLENTAYSKKSAPNSFTTSQGNYVWHRFYNLETGKGYFCTRSGKVYYDFAEFCVADKEENGGSYDRATGYDWAGSWLQKAGLNY